MTSKSHKAIGEEYALLLAQTQPSNRNSRAKEIVQKLNNLVDSSSKEPLDKETKLLIIRYMEEELKNRGLLYIEKRGSTPLIESQREEDFLNALDLISSSIENE